MPNDFYKPVAIVAREYLSIIGYEAYSTYIYLSFLASTKMDNKFNVVDLADRMNMDINTLEKSLQKLKICKLISSGGLTDDRNIKMQKIEIPVTEAKKDFIDKFIKKSLIDPSEKDKYYERASNAKQAVNKAPIAKIPQGPVKTMNLNSGIYPSDSAPGLVQYWYAKVNELFPTDTKPFRSRDIKKEASVISNVMKSNKDTPDETRAMMDYMISEAKRKDKIEDVAQMNFYSNKRNEAYYKAIAKKASVNTQKDTKIAKFVDKVDHNNLADVVEEMVGLYDYYVEKGKTKDYIINNIIKKKFNEDNVTEFIKRITAT